MKSWGYGKHYPGARIAVIRDTWPNLRDTTMKTFFEWFPEGLTGHYEAQKKTFWLNPARDGDPPTEILFRAMYDRDDMVNVLSLDLAAAHIDEPQGGISYRGEQGIVHEPGINQDLFHGILARLGRQSGGYPATIWLTGNPPAPTHWITKEFKYDPGKSGHDAPINGRQDFHLYLADQDTNRANLPPGYYERLTRLFGPGTPMERRFVQGLWIDFAQTKPFHREWFLHAGVNGAPTIPTEGLVAEIGYDPALGKKDTDSQTAIVIGGQDTRHGSTYGWIFLLAAAQGHWTVGEACDRLLQLCRAYNVRTVRVEKVAFQGALGEIIDRAAREAGLNLTVQLVTPDADKLMRASAWSPLVQEGRVIFGAGTEALEDAMASVPENRQAWDLVDAAGYCVRGFRRLPAEAQRIVEVKAHTPAFTYATQAGRRGGFLNPPPGQPLRARPRKGPPTGQRAGGYAVRRPFPGRGVAR